MSQQDNKDESQHVSEGGINQSVKFTADLGTRTIVILVAFALVMAANGYVMGLTMSADGEKTKALEASRREDERKFIQYTELKAAIEAMQKEQEHGRTSMPRRR